MITYHFIILVKNICVNIRMLQIEHIYQFLHKKLFRDIDVRYLTDGCLQEGIKDRLPQKYHDFQELHFGFLKNKYKILFYDQEPLHPDITNKFIDSLTFPNPKKHSIEYLEKILRENTHPYITNLKVNLEEVIDRYKSAGNDILYQQPPMIAVSEKSKFIDSIVKENNLKKLYYFFHGFAALDWFRGYLALNYTKNPIKNYKYDYQSFNRIVTGDRAYRKTFVDQLRSNDLLEHGAVSYGVTDEPVTEQRLVIDHEQLPGSASADIPDVDAFWHIVTETVFYYDKLHLTEKIFKPIVSKQPFMLLAAPGNLAYLRSYGFKTFEGIIDESYDTIEDNDARIDAVVKQIKWYCSLSDADKFEIQRLIAPVVEFNFHHFYGKFKEIITDELLDNTKKLFKDIDYDDSGIDYTTVRKLLTS